MAVLDYLFQLITEKRILQVAEQAFINDGTAAGLAEIDDTGPLRVGQIVSIYSDSITDPKQLKINRILGQHQVFLGELKSKVQERTDISTYTVADNAKIVSYEQNRPNIPWEEQERATYEEEPVVARRVFNVDQYGRAYNTHNPFPVKVDGTFDVNVAIDHRDDFPHHLDLHDSTRIGDGNLEMALDQAVNEPRLPAQANNGWGSPSIFDVGHSYEVRIQRRLMCSQDVNRALTWAEIDGVRRVTKIEWTSASLNTQLTKVIKLTRDFTYQGADPFDLVNINDTLAIT